MSETRAIILFTDLDGTLLEETTYSWEAARPALDRIRSLPIYLVPCSSKTRAELLPILEELDFQHPFIVENGGAVYFPESIAGIADSSQYDARRWIRVELGVPYRKLVDFLSRIGKELNIALTGFHDLPAAEIARLCGFSLLQAERAKAREYDEPFLLSSSEEHKMEKILAAAAREGLTITRGGRFFHVTGNNDKGHAIRTAVHLFRKKLPAIVTVGIGDSPNDLPMLQTVDLPILVQRPGGQYHPDLTTRLPGIRLAPGIGPVGWNRAVLDMVVPLLEGNPPAPPPSTLSVRSCSEREETGS